jgi:hypothetical protein
VSRMDYVFVVRREVGDSGVKKVVNNTQWSLRLRDRGKNCGWR